MNKEEIENVINILTPTGDNETIILFDSEIQQVIDLIDRQEKVIEQFAEDRLLAGGCRYLDNCFTKEDVINYYYKLIEENKNEQRRNRRIK